MLTACRIIGAGSLRLHRLLRHQRPVNAPLGMWHRHVKNTRISALTTIAVLRLATDSVLRGTLTSRARSAALEEFMATFEAPAAYLQLAMRQSVPAPMVVEDMIALLEVPVENLSLAKPDMKSRLSHSICTKRTRAAHCRFPEEIPCAGLSMAVPGRNTTSTCSPHWSMPA